MKLMGMRPRFGKSFARLRRRIFKYTYFTGERAFAERQLHASAVGAVYDRARLLGNESWSGL